MSERTVLSKLCTSLNFQYFDLLSFIGLDCWQWSLQYEEIQETMKCEQIAVYELTGLYLFLQTWCPYVFSSLFIITCTLYVQVKIIYICCDVQFLCLNVNANKLRV